MGIAINLTIFIVLNWTNIFLLNFNLTYVDLSSLSPETSCEPVSKTSGAGI